MIGDFNGDGILDLVGLDGVHPGLGDGTFGEPAGGPRFARPFGRSAGLRTMSAGDFNGDGKLDLLVSDFSYSTTPGESDVNQTLLLLLGNGDGTFQKTLYVSDRASMIPSRPISTRTASLIWRSSRAPQRSASC